MLVNSGVGKKVARGQAEAARGVQDKMNSRARQLLAAVIALAVAFPVAALPAKSTASKPEVAGIVAVAAAAAVRDAGAPAGTTIYSGDTLQTFVGGAIVAIGDSQVRFGAESRARLLREQGRVQVEIQRGRMSLRSSASSPVEARLADAVITPGDSAIAGIAVLSESKAMVTAERGSVTLRTSRDDKSVTLRPGESVEVTLWPEEQQPQDERERRRRGGAPLLSGKKVAILGAVLLGGISFAAWLIQHDNDLSAGQKQDLISPYQLH
jgi:hypothetical protein